MSQWVEASKASGGSGGRTLSETEPSNPSKGDEWIDTSYNTPATKIWDGNRWLVASQGSNLPPSETLSGSESKTYDVSDSNEEAEFTVIGQKGGSTFDNSDWEGPFPGGKGGRITATVDLSGYNTIKVDSQHQKGGSSGYYYDGADGGDSAAVLDGNDNVLIAAGGGGGAGGDHNDGKPGAGPNGGYGGGVSYGDGGDGGVYLDGGNPHLVKKTTTTQAAGSTEVRAFSNSPMSIE